jgi:hypothetical protein
MKQPQFQTVGFKVLARYTDGKLTHVTLRKKLALKDGRIKTKSFDIPADCIYQTIQSLENLELYP